MSGVKEERRGRKSAGRGKKEDKNAKAPKKQKVTPTQVIEKLPETIAESALLTQLQDLEKKIDYHVVRKQIELGETFRARTNRVTRNLRLTISNTYDNQAATYHIDPKADSSLYEPPSWTLRLEGHVVDDPSKELASALAKGAPPTTVKPRRRFTSFFKKIVIILDDRMEENIIEWERPVTGVEGDGFEIKRACDFESKARIQLYIDHNPPRYNLTQPLSSILNVHTETRTRVIVLLWQYIKLHRLIDPNDKRQVILNEPLKRVFGMDRVAFAAIPDLLREHLSPPEPLEFNYDIRLSGDPSTFEQSFSLQIEEDDDPILHQLQLTMARRKEVQLCDETIAKNIAAIHEHLKKREFMYGFAMDPVNFLNKLIKNQIRDLRIAKSEEAREQEEERYSMFFMQPYTPEAVSRFLMSINPNLLSSGVPGAGQGDGNQ